MAEPELCKEPLRAAELLRSGKLVAFPTETVYGLGVDATNATAVGRLFAVKGRPADNPLIVHIADRTQLGTVSQRIPDLAIKLLEHFAPGPLTVVVPKRPTIVDAVTAGLPTVGVRIPDEPRALEMLRAAQLPIAAPSANRSGKPSCTTYQSVIEDFGDAIDAILLGDPCGIGLESTVVDCTSGRPRVLRPGAITLEQLQSLDASIESAGRNVSPGENSPGRRHPHYRPRATVLLFDQPHEVAPLSSSAYIGLVPHPEAEAFGWHCAYVSVDQYAQAFYEALREVDRRGLVQVCCQRVTPSGTGAALSDRLQRAAE